MLNMLKILMLIVLLLLAGSTPTAPVGAPALSQVGPASINSYSVRISLQTHPTETFNNPSDMQNFILGSFPSSPKPAVDCTK